MTREELIGEIGLEEVLSLESARNLFPTGDGLELYKNHRCSDGRLAFAYYQLSPDEDMYFPTQEYELV